MPLSPGKMGPVECLFATSADRTMSFLSRLLGQLLPNSVPVPGWASFFTPPQYQRFLGHVAVLAGHAVDVQQRPVQRHRARGDAEHVAALGHVVELGDAQGERGRVVEAGDVAARAELDGVRADERLGEVGMAFVVLAAGAELHPDELVDWSRDTMANYKVPRAVEIVAELPVNATGKVEKDVLRARAAGKKG